MKLKLALLVGLFAFGYALSASAGAVVDTDGDLVPDQFDNCRTFANGPNQASNQVDTNLDGFGNACDADLDNNNSVGGSDFALFVGFFGQSTAAAKAADFDGDNVIGGSDFARFVALFGQAPGPSGLACAGTIPCTP
jgi:hypothetical protein